MVSVIVFSEGNIFTMTINDKKKTEYILKNCDLFLFLIYYL